GKKVSPYEVATVSFAEPATSEDENSDENIDIDNDEETVEISNISDNTIEENVEEDEPIEIDLPDISDYTSPVAEESHAETPVPEPEEVSSENEPASDDIPELEIIDFNLPGFDTVEPVQPETPAEPAKPKKPASTRSRKSKPTNNSGSSGSDPTLF
ncbi:MAG: hypothetical protein LUC24_00140, partial [Bacteroidales bacterium]|nr:hypothetical protein [Bacteroidales bacterium]